MFAFLLWVKQAVVSAVLAWAGVDYTPPPKAPPPPAPEVIVAPVFGLHEAEADCRSNSRRLVIVDEHGKRTVITTSSASGPACSARPMFDADCGAI